MRFFLLQEMRGNILREEDEDQTMSKTEDESVSVLCGRRASSSHGAVQHLGNSSHCLAPPVLQKNHQSPAVMLLEMQQERAALGTGVRQAGRG